MIYDGIVIGGGPAGMLAAIYAAEQGSNVLLLEKNEKPGKKLLITGKGRCNVTNNCSASDVLLNVPRNSKFLYSALHAYPPKKTMAFFEANGCPLKTERGNRVFPVSDKSSTVLTSLIDALKRHNVTVRTANARELIVADGHITGVKTDRGAYYAKWTILAVGGASYPATGSTGDGYLLAGNVGHSIVPPVGSLVPLESDADCIRMQGLSLKNVGVRLLNDKGKVLYKDFGELLFTHFGVSGPTVLSASAHIKGEGCKLLLDLKPALDEAKLNSRLLRDLEQYKNRSMENALTDLLPRSMIPVVLRKLSIDPQLQANGLRKEQRRAIVDLLKNYPVPIFGKRPVAEAIITSGGVKVSEVNPKTMESKIVQGLYFAGEILDCDAYTGGFNLQIAWSTGYTAGTSAKNSIDKQPGL